MAQATINFSALQTLTMTLNSLASDTTLLIGRQSALISNLSTLAIDVLVGGKFVSHSAAPTTSRQIEVWAISSPDQGTTYNAGAGASDAGLTLVAAKKALLRLVTIIPTDAATSSTYAWGPFSLAQVFGGVMPTHWGLWVVHNMGQILAAAGNEVKYTNVKYDSA